jgi:hypothetical protein
LLGTPIRPCSDFFIGENAHRSRSPGLDLQGKCSSQARPIGRPVTWRADCSRFCITSRAFW